MIVIRNSNYINSWLKLLKIALKVYLSSRRNVIKLKKNPFVFKNSKSGINKTNLLLGYEII